MTEHARKSNASARPPPSGFLGFAGLVADGACYVRQRPDMGVASVYLLFIGDDGRNSARKPLRWKQAP